MVGVAVNVVAVIIGSFFGLLLKKGIPERVNSAVMTGLGVCVLYIGISGSLSGENVLILIASIVLGAILGTLLNVDGVINSLALKVEKKFKKDGQRVSIAEGMVTASLLFCIGSMAATGSVTAGLTGDNSILITKSMIDMVSAMMLASTLGIGVMFSALWILVVEGSIVLLATLLAPVMSTGAINEMTCAGSILIVMIGTNMMGITKIKVADYLPAIIFAPVIYNLISLI